MRTHHALATTGSPRASELGQAAGPSSSRSQLDADIETLREQPFDGAELETLRKRFLDWTDKVNPPEVNTVACHSVAPVQASPYPFH